MLYLPKTPFLNTPMLIVSQIYYNIIINTIKKMIIILSGWKWIENSFIKIYNNSGTTNCVHYSSEH